jgi:hypothetical protein
MPSSSFVISHILEFIEFPMLVEVQLSKSSGDACTEPQADERAAMDRRSFLASGVVASAAALATQPAAAAEGITWDREADVVVLGAGGLTAAVAAREKGASVIIVEQNFDIGGRAMMSSGGLYIGGGNRMQGLVAPGTADRPLQRSRIGSHLC